MNWEEPEFEISSVFPFMGVALAPVEEPESCPVDIESAPALEELEESAPALEEVAKFEEVEAPENDPDNPAYYYSKPSWNSSWVNVAAAIMFLCIIGLFILHFLYGPAEPPENPRDQREPLRHVHK